MVRLKFRLSAYFCIAVLIVLFFDRVTKQSIRDFGDDFISINISQNLQFVKTYNRGVSFGLMNNLEQNQYLWLALNSIISLIMIIWMCLLLKQEGYSGKRSVILVTSVGMIVGGALSNSIDRIIWGGVLDFLDFHIGPWHYPAFNVADAAVVSGAVLFSFMHHSSA